MEESFLQRRRSLTAGANLPPSVSELLRRSILDTTFSIPPLVQTLGRDPTVGVGSPWNSSVLPFFGRGRVAPPLPQNILKNAYFFEKNLRSVGGEVPEPSFA